MAYDPEVPGCFGRMDGRFALHTNDKERAFRWLSKLRERRADWDEARRQLGEYLREQNCHDDHIYAEVAVAEKLLAPWLWGSTEEE